MSAGSVGSAKRTFVIAGRAANRVSAPPSPAARMSGAAPAGCREGAEPAGYLPAGRAGARVQAGRLPASGLRAGVPA